MQVYGSELTRREALGTMNQAGMSYRESSFRDMHNYVILVVPCGGGNLENKVWGMAGSTR